MDKSELIKALADYGNREEVVKVAIEDENVRLLLFSLVEERAKDKTLNIPVDDKAYSKKINRELDILHDSMDAISGIGGWDSQLVQPIILPVIDLLDYEFYYTNQRAAEIIASAVNKDSIRLIRPAIPKLINLLEYHEIIIEDTTIDNGASVENAKT